jgi:outer membrane biosynthesis protein TonB
VTSLKRISLLLVLGACLAAAGCGGDEEGAPIPADQAAQLQSQLDIVEARLDNGSVGACQDIFQAEDANQTAVTNILNTMPEGVDPEVRDALEQSFENLWSLVERGCEEAAAEQPDEPAPAPEPETTVTETQPETTETVPPPEETVPPEEEQLPEEGDGDNDGAIPGDGGGGVGPGASKEKKPKEKKP